MIELGNFDVIRISLASPQQILEWSYGEVNKPETINYRTLKPERDGLFSERIFGPEKDWECSCGKYKRERYKGIVCDKCGVEVASNRVRRERMGHITLASPVSHIWYVKGMPCRLGLLLDISPRDLEKVLYYAVYIITKVNEDARKRLMVRKEKELALNLTKQQAITAAAMGTLDQEEADKIQSLLDRRDTQISELDEEIAKRSGDAIGQAQALIQWVQNRVGEKAEETMKLSWVRTAIVVKGRKVDAAKEEEVNEHVQLFLDELKKESDNRKEEISREIEIEMNQIREAAADRKEEIEVRDKTERDKLISSTETWLEQLKSIEPRALKNDQEYRTLSRQYGTTFEIGMGAEAILELLKQVDLDELAREMRVIINTSKSEQKRTRAAKRLKEVEDLRKSGNKPEWMILTQLPVIPPELRPMVQLDGGRFATSDLNDLYRRVINRNNRLKRLQDLGAPDVIVRNEKRMLQEAVDSLIDNRKRNRTTANRNQKHPLKSLTDMLKGKQGRFRRNLLGKRVDYSGRSVIVIGPNLKLEQAGIPKRMALELFKPFVIERLVNHGSATNVRHAKRMVDEAEEGVWDVLEKVCLERPVLLNRAPTLHRLGIQAFEVKLIEGSAIQLHPLVCTAFNADFDGDQMAVHVPLSKQAVKEARELMLSTHNLLKPSSGEPIISPTKDMVMGVFYLTAMENEDRPDSDLRRYPNVEQAEYAFEMGQVSLREPILVRIRPHVEKMPIEELALSTRCLQALQEHGIRTAEDLQARLDDDAELFKAEVKGFGDVFLQEAQEVLAGTDLNVGSDDLVDFTRTTPGRIIFNRVLPEPLRFVNERLDKSGVNDLVQTCYRRLGQDVTAEVADQIKRIGFQYATRSGITIAVSDLQVPAEKAEIIKEAQNREAQAETQYLRGLLTSTEWEDNRVQAWSRATDQVSSRIKDGLDPLTSVGAMSISGAAKGGHSTINQLAGMRGLMFDPNGRIIPMPIRSSFRDGLSTMEFFISTHGSRKGLADTALRTADAGYLTRRLVDVSQDVIITQEDCGTPNGILVDIRSSQKDRFWERVSGRCVAQQVNDPETDEVILDRDQLIVESEVLALVERGVKEIEIRSPLTCESRFGLCLRCYGADLASDQMVQMGTAVGIIAAQSIGEPGTQLTLRTFHTGGVASSDDITRGLPRVEELFEARIPKGQAVISEIDGKVKIYWDREIRRLSVQRMDLLTRELQVPVDGWTTKVTQGDAVQSDTVIAERSSQGEVSQEELGNHTIMAGMEGTVLFPLDASIQDQNGYIVLTIQREDVVEWDSEIPAHTSPLVSDGDYVHAGDQLTPGALEPKGILRIQGREACQLYILNEVQKVYREQGVQIHDKHIEVILRQLLRRVQVQATGDTEFLLGEYVDRYRFEDVNNLALENNRKPAQGMPVILGMTRAALNTESFLAAASFQETTRVLTDAAIRGQEDRLRGLKENVILGKLIPVGTGFHSRLEAEAKVGAGSSDLDLVGNQGEMESLNLDLLQELTDSEELFSGALAVDEVNSLQKVSNVGGDLLEDEDISLLDEGDEESTFGVLRQ